MDSYDVIAEAVKDYWKVNYPQDVIAFFQQKYSWDNKWESCEELVECHGSDDYENMTFLSDFCEGQTEVKDVIIVPLREVTAFYYKRKIENHESEPQTNADRGVKGQVPPSTYTEIAYRRGNMKHLGDITQLNGHELPVVDCIIGGSPCQDLSVAGKRAGLAGERSGLFMEQMRIVKEMREHDRLENGRSGYLCRPRFMVWENVPGAFSSGTPKGADFQAVLEEITKIVCKEAPPVSVPKDGWPKAGCISGVGDSGCTFSIAWRLHDAQFWGVPQRRKRIALVADFGGLSAPEVLFERKGLRGYSAESGETW